MTILRRCWPIAAPGGNGMRRRRTDNNLTAAIDAGVLSAAFVVGGADHPRRLPSPAQEAGDWSNRSTIAIALERDRSSIPRLPDYSGSRPQEPYSQPAAHNRGSILSRAGSLERIDHQSAIAPKALEGLGLEGSAGIPIALEQD